MFFKSVLAVAVALLTTSVSAQVGANSTIDASTITLTERNQWCSAQQSTCGLLCDGDGGADPNICSGDDLSFTCTCTGNKSSPGLQYYTGTMPTFICEQLFKNCIAKNVGVATAQAKCNADEKANCGHLDPAKYVASSTSSSAPSTPTTTPAGGADAASPTAPPSSSSSAAAATMIAVAGQYGSGVLVAGVAAAFGMLL